MNPSCMHLTVPVSVRLRREHPEWITIHRADLAKDEILLHEGLPVTAVERSMMDVLSTSRRTEIARQAIAEALRKELLHPAQAGTLRRQVNRAVHALTATTNQSKVTAK